MKTLFTICLLLCSLLYVQGQSIDKQVIASAGNTQSNTTNQLTSTIGEPIIGLKGSTVTIHQGFLAGASNATLSVEELVTSPEVTIYPNPFTDLVNISIPENQGKVTATVYNNAGKQTGVYTMSNSLKTLNLEHLAQGMYLVQLHFTTTNTFKSFKIIKK